MKDFSMKRHVLWRTACVVALLGAGVTTVGAQTGPVRFNDIRVAGNERLTQAEVLELCEITAERSYNNESLEAMVGCLGESGRFRDISLGTEGRDLIITVDEAPQYTGFLDVSVSADTDRGVSARLEVQDRDLFDRGLLGGFEIEAAQEEQSAQATLANPDLWGRGWTGGVTLSFQNVDYDDQSYSYRRGVLAGFLEMPLAEQQTLTFRAGLQGDEMFDIAATASPILQREEGQRVSPFVSLGYDGVFLPEAMPNTRFELQASQAFVGLGEDHVFSNTRVRGRAATAAIPDRLNLGFALEAGHVESLGDEGPRALDRFNLGGASFRGFAPRGIGPADGGERLGGTSYAVASFDTNTPLAQFGQVQVEGGVFVDVGAVWGLEDTAGFADPVDDSLQWRSTAGVSVTANIGDVPVTLYYAEPIRSAPGDSLQEFGLTLRARF